MSPKKIEKKKKLNLKNIKSLMPKNLNLDNFKVNPTRVIEKTKDKIENYYYDLKRKREKQKKK